MGAGLLLLFAVPILAAAPGQPLQQALSRVSEEAEVFRSTAPKILAREQLVQRALKPPRRFRPRLGNAALEPPKPQYRTREVVSEYAFATLKESPGALHEFRQVMSVDGRTLASAEKARRTLTAGLRSEDERAKKRMLEDFEKHGLTGATADFGQILLLFTRPRLGDYAFGWAGDGLIGAERARIISFKQKSGSGSLMIFEERKAVHQPLEGEIWVRETDGMPLRVTVTSLRDEQGHAIRDEAQVDYLMTQHGYLAPASVTHRQTSANNLVVENLYRYSTFQIFEAETDVSFPEAK
jgi:hypothetical protein